MQLIIYAKENDKGISINGSWRGSIPRYASNQEVIMKSMTVIYKNDLMAFFENDRFGRARAKVLRKYDVRFKWSRILSVIQAYPKGIVYGKVYDSDGFNTTTKTWL